MRRAITTKAATEPFSGSHFETDELDVDTESKA
jgi:hypothetical protein